MCKSSRLYDYLLLEIEHLYSDQLLKEIYNALHALCYFEWQTFQRTVNRVEGKRFVFQTCKKISMQRRRMHFCEVLPAAVMLVLGLGQSSALV